MLATRLSPHHGNEANCSGPVREWAYHRKPVKCVHVNPVDSNYIATASGDGWAYVSFSLLSPLSYTLCNILWEDICWGLFQHCELSYHWVKHWNYLPSIFKSNSLQWDAVPCLIQTQPAFLLQVWHPWYCTSVEQTVEIHVLSKWQNE